MPRYIPFLAVLVLASLALPAAASARTARVTTTLNMRAGPSTNFPVVTTINDGARVLVHGCVGDYSWCDVSWAGNRGWVDASFLTYPYHNSYVPIIDYGAEIDLPIVVFSVDTYWGDYYHGRPWYHRRHYWHDYWRRHHNHYPHHRVHHRDHHHHAVEHRHERHHRFHRQHFGHHGHVTGHRHRPHFRHFGGHHFSGHRGGHHFHGGGRHFAHHGGGHAHPGGHRGGGRHHH